MLRNLGIIIPHSVVVQFLLHLAEVILVVVLLVWMAALA